MSPKLSRRALVLSIFYIFLIPLASSRPSIDDAATALPQTERPQAITKEYAPSTIGNRDPSSVAVDTVTSKITFTPAVINDPRVAKTRSPIIGESIKMVANQLLHTSTLSTLSPVEPDILDDVRTPPKMKNHIANKQKLKKKPEKNEDAIENSNAGVAMPVTIEEIEHDYITKNTTKESSTSHEGISTWILLSNPSSTERAMSKESTVYESTSKEMNKNDNNDLLKEEKKPNRPKNKPAKKNPIANAKPATRRPIAVNANKSDIVASGSAVNENVLNKIKASVLANVQKNKNAAADRTTPSTSPASSTAQLVTKKEFTTKRTPTTISTASMAKTEKIATKIHKQKNKNNLSSSKISATLPAEAKNEEIELEINTPPTTTKKPKRTTIKRKKNKTRRRKPSTSTVTKTKTQSQSVSENKISNATKSVTKPQVKQKPISTQIYNYLSREVMPTVGVGIVGLAGLVGLASYFLYPFAGPVRRAYEITDKKDDLYRHNAEEYANEGNGQAEEDMLGTVLAGMPTHNNRVNPYVNQTPYRYSQPKKEPDQYIRYRQVASSPDTYNTNSNAYNIHYPQQKTGIAHGAVYSEPISYTPHESENKNVYSGYAAAEPVYSHHNLPSATTNYRSDIVTPSYTSKPIEEGNFEPVYPFEGQVFSDSTNNPMSTSMYLGSDNESNPESSVNYEISDENDKIAPQFVVGNIPKELIQSITPAVVPEHGPRHLREKRSPDSKRSIADSIEQVLLAAKDETNDTYLSNEIDAALGFEKPYANVFPTKPPTSKYFPAEITIHTVKPNVRTTKGVDTTEYQATETSRLNFFKDSSTNSKFTVDSTTSQSTNFKSETESDRRISTKTDDLHDFTTFKKTEETPLIENISTHPLGFGDEITVNEITTSSKDLTANNDNPSSTTSTTENYVNNDIEHSTPKEIKIYEVFSTAYNPDLKVNTADDFGKFSLNYVETTSSPSTKTPKSTTAGDNKFTSGSATEPNVSTSKTPSSTNLEENSTTEKNVQIELNLPAVKNETSTFDMLFPPKHLPKPNSPDYSEPTNVKASNNFSFFTFIKRLLDFKFRVGMSIIQSTSETLARYLRGAEGTARAAAKASEYYINNKH